MKYGILTATVGALMFALTAQAVTVDGSVFLSGQTDHAGTKIVFEAVSPSAQTDSTVSTSSGHYQKVLQAGVYDVEFSNDGYASIELEDQVLVFDTTVETQELMFALSGYVSGTVGPGNFDVWDTLRVGEGSELQILPGTRLYFRNTIPFIVRGQMDAIGTAQDSILFTSRALGEFERWGGIRFDGPVDSQRFEYCLLELTGGYRAIWSSDALLRITHCEVRSNSTGEYTGVLTCLRGSLNLSQSLFHGNDTYGGYGSVHISQTAADISDCRFDSNSCGISSSSQSFLLRSCTFTRNDRAISFSGGIVENCIVSESSQYYDAAVWCGGTSDLRHCTIRGTVQCSGEAVVRDCIIAFSDHDYHGGVDFYYTANPRVEHCCIYGNAGGNFSGYAPPGIGIVALTNANGDSCDTYYNIFLDPLFVNTDSGDYHLTLGSPCIDAGDPDLPHDPDGTVADMGAFYFDQLPVMEDGHNILCPNNLAQNYPNPFNARTRISFSLAQAGEVSLNVFDITGRLVSTLADGRMTAGTHEVSLDARDLPSGVYVYRLAAGNAVEAKKMVVIK